MGITNYSNLWYWRVPYRINIWKNKKASNYLIFNWNVLFDII